MRMGGGGHSSSFLTQVEKNLSFGSAVRHCFDHVQLLYISFHQEIGLSTELHESRMKKQKKKRKKNIVRKTERKPGEKTKKEIIKEPEPDIGLYPNERLPLQSNSKGKNINTIILFFSFLYFFPF